MIDGLWLRKAAGSPIPRAQSVTLVLTQIMAQISDAELAALQQDLTATQNQVSAG